MDVCNSLDSLNDIENLSEIDLICPYCHTVIEIFNNNLDFSLDFHSQSSTHLRSIQTLQSDDSIQEEDRKCIIINFIIENITPNLKHNTKYVTFSNGYIHCELCSFNIEFCSDEWPDIKDVEKHFSSEMHATRSKIIDEGKIDESILFKNFHKIEKKLKDFNIMQYLVLHNNRVHCILCDIDLCISSDLSEMNAKVESHMIGIHLENILKGIRSLPKNDEKLKHFHTEDQRLKCRLCSTVIKVENVEQTFLNADKHLRSKHLMHVKKQVDYEDEMLLDETTTENMLLCLPDHISVNRYYIIMSIEGRYFCQLCSCLIDTSYACVLNHVQSSDHLKFLQAIKETAPTDYLNEPTNSGKNIPLRDFEYLLDEGPSESNIVSQNKRKSRQLELKSVLKDYEGLKKQFETPLPAIIEKNMHFIVKFKNNYKCSLCNACLMFDHDILKLKNNFKPHLNSLTHKQAVRKYLNLPPIQVRNKHDDCDDFKSDVGYIPTNKKKLNPMIPQSDNNKRENENIQPKIKHSLLKETFSKINVYSSSSVSSKKSENYSTKYETNLQCNTPERSEYSLPLIDQMLEGSETILDYVFVKQFLHPYLPQQVERNKQFIVKKTDNSFECTLCKAKFCMTSNTINNVKSFCQHFDSKKHISNVETAKSICNTKRRSQSEHLEVNSPSVSSKIMTDYELVIQFLHPYLPQQVKKNRQFIVKKSDNRFECTLCCAKLYVTPNSINNVNSFCQHFDSKKHISKVEATKSICNIKSRSQSEHLEVNALSVSNKIMTDYEFVKRFLHPYLPQQVEKNKQFIVKKTAKTFECTLCKATLCMTPNVNSNVNLFCQHFDGKNHISKVEVTKPTCNTKTSPQSEHVKVNAPSVSTEIMTDYKLVQKFLHPYLPQQVEKNKQFIVKKTDNSFECTSCKATLCMTPNVNCNVNLFCQHFDSKNHITKVEAKKPTCNTKTSSQSEHLEVNAPSVSSEIITDYEFVKKILHPYLPQQVEKNKQFIVKKTAKTFECTLCKVTFSMTHNVNSNVNLFCQHFDGKNHISNVEATKLTCNKSGQQSEHLNVNAPSVSCKIMSDYDVIKIFLHPYLPLQVEKNKEYIVKKKVNRFECTLCNAAFSMSSNAVSNVNSLCQHFDGRNHISNVEATKLTCNKSGQQSKHLNVNAPSVRCKIMTDFEAIKKFLHPYLPLQVEKNKEFIVKKKGNKLQCTLCNAAFSMSSFAVSNVNLLCQHFDGKNHIENLKLQN